MLTERERRRLIARSLVRDWRGLKPLARQWLYNKLLRRTWHLSRLLPGGYVLPPLTVFLGVNAACNLRCLTCDVGQRDDTFHARLLRGDESNQLTLAEIGGVLDSVAFYKPVIQICATEPLLRPDIIDVVRAITARGFQLQMFTNGYLLPDCAEALAEAGLHLLIISIDSHDPHTNDMLRGRAGAWDRAVRGLEAVIAYRRRRGGVLPLVQLECTVSKHNYRQLYEYAAHFSRYEISSINFSLQFGISAAMAEEHNRHCPGMAVETSRSRHTFLTDIDPDELIAQKRRIQQEFDEYPVYFAPNLSDDHLRLYHLHPEREIPGFSRCDATYHFVRIESDGGVLFGSGCFVRPFGNVREEPLLRILNRAPMRAFRARMNRDGLFPACTRCNTLYCGSMQLRKEK